MEYLVYTLNLQDGDGGQCIYVSCGHFNIIIAIHWFAAYICAITNNIYVMPTVWNHMEYLNTMMLAELNDTYQIRYVYDMGPMLRGYAALINDK